MKISKPLAFISNRNFIFSHDALQIEYYYNCDSLELRRFATLEQWSRTPQDWTPTGSQSHFLQSFLFSEYRYDFCFLR